LQRRAAGLPITFLGFVSRRTDLAKLLASSDVSLAPGPHETFGLAALEALASGTPVVVSHSSALPEIVLPSCGSAVANDARAFADAVCRLLDTPQRSRRAAARARAEQFSVAGGGNGDARCPPRASEHAMNRPWCLGDRSPGAAGYRPEHTLAPYELVTRLGADFIEPAQWQSPCGDFDICLIDEPPVTTGMLTPPRGVDEQRLSTLRFSCLAVANVTMNIR
jgi:glycosyl transferase family 1